MLLMKIHKIQKRCRRTSIIWLEETNSLPKPMILLQTGLMISLAQLMRMYRIYHRVSQIWNGQTHLPSILSHSLVFSGTLKSPASRLFTQSFIQTQIKENIKATRHWPLCGEFTGDRWIPRTNGQLRGKCFHLMTSSWRCGVLVTLL